MDILPEVIVRIFGQPFYTLAFLSIRLYNQTRSERDNKLSKTMSRSSNLYDLQIIDSQLDKHHNRLLEIAKILADDSEINRTKANLQEKTESLSEAESNLRSAERKVKEQRLKIKQTEAKLYGGKIRNPKELQDLQDESEALKRYLSVLEDRQLECMLALDDEKERVVAAQGDLTNIIEHKEKLQQILGGERHKIEIDMQVLEGKKISFLEMISANDLTIYNNLRKQRFGVAVSKVNDRACSACGATLTASTFQAARSPNTITKCEACGRILYAD